MFVLYDFCVGYTPRTYTMNPLKSNGRQDVKADMHVKQSLNKIYIHNGSYESLLCNTFLIGPELIQTIQTFTKKMANSTDIIVYCGKCSRTINCTFKEVYGLWQHMWIFLSPTTGLLSTRIYDLKRYKEVSGKWKCRRNMQYLRTLMMHYYHQVPKRYFRRNEASQIISAHPHR